MQWDWWWEAWPRISFLLNRSIIALRCYVRICYTTVWVSCMCTCVSSLLDLPTIIPPVSHHRAPSWGPCTIRQCPTSSLLYTGECTYVSAEGLFSPYFFYHGADLDRVMWNNQSVQFSHSVMSDSLQPHGLQHARPPCPSLTPRACSNSCPLSQWCHPTISSSVVPFSSCLQSLPASGSFPMRLFLMK